MLAIRRLSGVLVVLVVSLPAAMTDAANSTATVAARDNTPWTLPTRPPACSSKQIDSGAVSGCLLANWNSPDSNGWPTPPFPSDPVAGSDAVGVLPFPGWTWGGYGYNGSAALSGWESLLVSNETAIGPVRAKQFRTMPDVLPLFEGFVRDIVAGGYRVTDAATYSFRCTSGSGRTCQGKTRDALSNHAWGLAMDMNSGANPEATYTGIDGASACATPVTTDLPQWVIQTAEKWGLYWGGYGWNSGCDSPGQLRSTATRDATHFEFRGTPEQARAIAAFNLGGACLQVADDSGAIGPRCTSPGDAPRSNWRVVVDTKAPAGATAALVNLTLTGAGAPGYVTAESCTAHPAGPRTSSNGNTSSGRTVANLAVVPLDASGRFCLYRSQAMHTIVDVEGFFAPAAVAGPSASLFTAVNPERVMDTRIESFCGPAGACSERGPVRAGTELAIALPHVPDSAVATLANLTVTDAANGGYLTADSCAALTPGDQSHSNSNFAAGDTVANLAVIPISPDPAGAQICTFATSQVQKVVDVQGYFAPSNVPDGATAPVAGGWGYSVVPTERLIDTRGCWTDAASGNQRCAQPAGIGDVLHLRAPTGASAVLVNLTLTDASSDGFATADACSRSNGTPTESSANVAAGKAAANLAVVQVDPDGTFCLTVSAPMHVIVDIQGTFSPKAGLRFLPISPVRRSDTRQPGA